MLDIDLLPKQAEVFLPDEGVDYDIKLYQGGVGSGKTFLGSLVGLSVLSQNHGATWLVGADTLTRLDITTCETYEELLSDAHIRYKFNRSKHIIKIPGWDDARVIFKGIADPFSLRSVNGIGGHIEEASLVPESSYLEFLGRLRQKTNDPIRTILTTNPQAQKGWLHENFVDKGGITEEEVRGNIIKLSRRRVIARTLDNPYVSDAFIATLKASYDPELYKIMVLGQDGDYTRGLVSYNFSSLNVMETPYRRELEIYLWCDFNVDPMCWVLAHRFNGEYHFFDEIVIENTNINECVDEFVRRYPDHSAGIVIGGDASGGSRNVQNDVVGGTSYTSMMNRLNDPNGHNYREVNGCNVRIDIREQNPPIADRVSAWNGMMHNENGVRRIYISPKCKWLIWNLQNLKYKDGTGVIDTPNVNQIEKDHKKKFTGHPFDAASYLIEKYDPIMLRATKMNKSTTVPSALNNLLRRKR